MIVLLALLAAASEPVVSPAAPRVELAGSRGGVRREFGGTDWIVSANSDARLVVLAARGNPYHPAFMFVSMLNGKVNVTGPPSVLRRAAAAVRSLKALGPAGLATLDREAIEATHRTR